MNIRQIFAQERVRAGVILSGPLRIGDEVTVDGMTSRGVVVGRRGKRLIIQIKDWRGAAGYRSGYRIERDAMAVHRI